MPGQRGRPRQREAARCPDPTHKGSHVVANDSRRTDAALTHRFICTPLLGARHTFTVVLEVDQPAAVAPAVDKPARPRHPGGHVVHDGTYGRRSPIPRQRYRCFPDPGDRSVFHSFTSDLPRQHIHPAGEQCEVCDEHRGVHHGEPAAARQHSLPARTVARGLEMLAAGGSYADVSRWALRLEAAEADKLDRRRAAHATADRPDPASTGAPAAADQGVEGPSPDAGAVRMPVQRRSGRTSVKELRVVVTGDGTTRRHSRASVEARNVWHIAADWCEVFGPVVWHPLEERLRAQALTDRARLDTLKGAGSPLQRPQVLLIDDIPVYGKDGDGSARRRRGEGFFLLVAAEVAWSAPDPWDEQHPHPASAWTPPAGTRPVADATAAPRRQGVNRQRPARVRPRRRGPPAPARRDDVGGGHGGYAIDGRNTAVHAATQKIPTSAPKCTSTAAAKPYRCRTTPSISPNIPAAAAPSGPAGMPCRCAKPKETAVTTTTTGQPAPDLVSPAARPARHNSSSPTAFAAASPITTPASSIAPGRGTSNCIGEPVNR